MPITGPSSYPATVEEFLAHWALVDAELGAGTEMTLAVGDPKTPTTVTRADLVTIHTGLEDFQNSVQSALNTKELARGTVTMEKEALLPLAQAYGRKVKGLFPPGNPYLNMTPEMPELSSGQETFLRPMRDIRDAWTKIDSGGNNFALPPDNTSLDDFSDKVNDLEASWQALNTAEVELGYERDKRNALQDNTVEILGRYRPTVESLFAPENPLYVSIPRLRPLPGHTPESVSLTAVWDAGKGKARLTWSQSTEATLDYYQIRMSPANPYEADGETVVANLSPEDARELLTLEGLATPGAVASFKVFVVLTTGHERGSNAPAVTRP